MKVNTSNTITLKRSVLIACLFLLGFSAVFAQSGEKPEIKFINKDWSSILLLAKQQHKPIFVDAYAIWCAPCKELKSSTFRDRKLAVYFNAHYINVSIDVEKGEGTGLADKYDVNSYPTLLFIDGEGNLIKKKEGFVDAKQLMAIASAVK